MAAVIKAESTLTDRYQTTVPDLVRRALGLEKRDRINYRIQPDGTVLLARAEPKDQDDPVLTKFLGFIADDIEKRPQAVRAIGRDWLQGMQSLVEGVEIDLDTKLSEEDE